MPLGLSNRAVNMPASPIRKLVPLADEAKRRGVHIYHLNIGQPDIETPSCMLARLGTIEDRVLAYTPSVGTPEFLAAMQHYYAAQGIPLDTKQIIATTGGSEALLFSFMACANPGDEAIVPEPFYANYLAFAQMSGVKLVPLATSVENGFHLPPIEAWKAAITERTRFIVLCNPNNPTGTVYEEHELRMVLELCREHSLYLVADEVYREFVYDGRRAMSALAFPEFSQHVIVADSLSKRYSACGIRLGVFVTRNLELYDAAYRMAQGRLSAPGIAQMIAAAATQLGPEYTDNVITEYQKRRDVLYEGLSTIPGVFLRRPEGAFYFVARLPVADADAFARWLLTDFSHDGATVMVAPASGFYATPGGGKDMVRIAYVLNEHDLRKSVEILRLALAAYPARVEAALQAT
nr:Aminotransferase class I and II [uncultured bacterium]